ncbi:hypothetical protein FOC1_g10004031 [Fusarium oxysporum f. sp. cubense race 1]|uniref:MalT-like TPR region domain-containing protein n=2 Tax=Fusarium oxysporum TaxID=5507 RepID=N4U9D3_FUSC1|nr:hypothetical protein FOC1_g10004031 [Fusarium oxysporum f. sp. cubense race 1]
MACLCGCINQLIDNFDPKTAAGLASGLNKHLEAIRSILARNKSLAKEVRYQIIPSNQRTAKILSLHSIDLVKIERLHSVFKDDVKGFWVASGDALHQELRRRIACITIFLRSKVDDNAWASYDVANLIQGRTLSELRYAGSKYIKIARRLGGIGSILWLPLEIPASTYERYLNMDDAEAFDHIQNLGSDAPDLNLFVQRLITAQLDDPSLVLSHRNLLLEYGDCISPSEQGLLLLHALGGNDIPLDLLKSAKIPMRRWTNEGEIQSITASDFGFNAEIIRLLSSDERLEELSQRPEVTQQALEDGTIVWSLSPEAQEELSHRLTPQTTEDWATTALKLLCFACPPCYEGKVNWYAQALPLKKAIWNLLDKATNQKRLPSSLRACVIEALLFFCERDLFSIRFAAVERAKSLLRKNMSFYYQASVTLFDSIISRIDGNFQRSEALIVDFLAADHEGNTRSDNALRGRLHISNIENKIHRYDKEVASTIYNWEGIHPLSTFEIEVTRRLQGVAAKFFHSIGDFKTTRASLEQHLWLNSTMPIRPNTRLLIVTRLAEIHCELHEYEKALEIIQVELDGMTARKGRPFRRLSMARAEGYIGLGRLDDATTVLQELISVEPPELDDLNDQVLRVRRLILSARIHHEGNNFPEALQHWQLTGQMIDRLGIFKSRHGWILAIVHLSMAHAHIALGNEELARQAWNAGVEIAMRERFEYVFPVLATTWLHKIVGEIHEVKGWPLRVMLPGGKSDLTWLWDVFELAVLIDNSIYILYKQRHARAIKDVISNTRPPKTKGPLICAEELFVSDSATESHYRRGNRKNKGAERVGAIQVDVSLLRDEGLTTPEEDPTNKAGKKVGARHYKITLKMRMRL